MKPFLLLTVRAEQLAADNEYEAFRAFTGLSEGELVRRSLPAGRLGEVELGAWSGIFLGGSPYNASDPPARKTATQRRVEADLHALLDLVVAADFPFLGACYGIGMLVSHEGGVVDRQFGEPVGAVRITLTADGRDDQLMGALPAAFDAFVGHKEAVSTLPGHAVLLAGSAGCPVQAFRIGQHVYATQFHPELDVHGLQTRIDVYRHAGYFAPDEADHLKAMADRSVVSHPPLLLRRFVELYGAGEDGGPTPLRSGARRS